MDKFVTHTRMVICDSKTGADYYQKDFEGDINISPVYWKHENDAGTHMDLPLWFNGEELKENVCLLATFFGVDVAEKRKTISLHVSEDQDWLKDAMIHEILPPEFLEKDGWVQCESK